MTIIIATTITFITFLAFVSKIRIFQETNSEENNLLYCCFYKHKKGSRENTPEKLETKTESQTSGCGNGKVPLPAASKARADFIEDTQQDAFHSVPAVPLFPTPRPRLSLITGPQLALTLSNGPTMIAAKQSLALVPSGADKLELPIACAGFQQDPAESLFRGSSPG